MDAKPNPNCPICGGDGRAWLSYTKDTYVPCSCLEADEPGTVGPSIDPYSLFDETGNIESVCSDHVEAWEDN